eukprot:983673-Amphidinium_carterae.2
MFAVNQNATSHDTLQQRGRTCYHRKHCWSDFVRYNNGTVTQKNVHWEVQTSDLEVNSLTLLPTELQKL